MEGSNTSMSNENGNFLFASNGCKVVNAKKQIMENGDGINPGIIGDFYCPFGGSPLIQGVIAIPSPEGDSLYYVFNLDYDQPYVFDTMFYGVAPQRLYYQKIDMTHDSGYGAIVLKNQIAILDTFARGYIKAVRHANGKDWWIIVPKSHSNCYFLVPITSEGVQPAQLKCSGKVWTDDDSGGQAVFTPDGKKYIRFNWWNGLNIFNFNTATGDLSNPIDIMFPNDTINYVGGAAVSSNSRYLYVCARKKVYQFDLQAPNVEDSKVLVAVYDGYQNPNSTIFYLAALAPDSKIYISSTSSTLNLHVINKPNCPGLSCELEQHGVVLPAYNFATIPNMPHYGISNDNCDSTSNTDAELADHPVLVYPNPTKRTVWINLKAIEGGEYEMKICNITGQLVFSTTLIQPLSNIDISQLKNGAYYYSIKGGSNRANGIILKIE